MNHFDNLDLICNARSDTVLYHLPPAPTGKRGRPWKRGDRIRLEEFSLSKPKTGDWEIGVSPVMTNLWKDKVVYAVVTAPKKWNGSRRLFLCTKNPEEVEFDLDLCADETIRTYGKEDRLYLPLAWYGLRWNIEISYYEGKTFWSIEEYRIRTRKGIERLINLMSLSYSAMSLLPYSDDTFSEDRSASAQETRYGSSQQILASIIWGGFGRFLETLKNSSTLIKIVENYILSAFRKVPKL